MLDLIQYTILVADSPPYSIGIFGNKEDAHAYLKEQHLLEAKVIEIREGKRPPDRLPEDVDENYFPMPK